MLCTDAAFPVGTDVPHPPIPSLDRPRDPVDELHRLVSAQPFDGLVDIRAVCATGWVERPTLIACVPARDEAALLPDCLAALRASLAAVGSARSAILVLANNCADETYRIAADAARSDGPPILACDATFASAIADIGHVRRFALEWAAALCGPEAILLSTDADTLVAPDWAAALAATLDQGAAMAYGPVLSKQTIASLDQRAASMAELEDALRTVQADLWAALVPSHSQALGLTPGAASMAVRASAYCDIGGLPPLPVAEDRALAERFITKGHVVAFADDAQVHSSVRLSGRVTGGMADTLATRCAGDGPCDTALLPTKRFAWLALAYRLLAGDGDSAHALMIARKLGVPVSLLLPSTAPLGERWSKVRNALPAIEPMSAAQARAELRTARALVAAIREMNDGKEPYLERPMLVVEGSDV